MAMQDSVKDNRLKKVHQAERIKVLDIGFGNKILIWKKINFSPDETQGQTLNPYRNSFLNNETTT